MIWIAFGITWYLITGNAYWAIGGMFLAVASKVWE